MSKYYNDIVGLCEEFKDIIDREADDEPMNMAGLVILCKKAKKSWKKDDKPQIRENIADLNLAIEQDEKCVKKNYDIAQNSLKLLLETGDEKHKKQLKKCSVMKKQLQLRIALCKKAVVVYSHAHNEDFVKAEKHREKLLVLIDEYDAFLSKMLNCGLPGQYIFDEMMMNKTITDGTETAINTSKMMAEIVRKWVRTSKIAGL